MLFGMHVPLVGWLIAAATGLAFVLAAVIVAVQAHRMQPDLVYRKVGVKYWGDAKPWGRQLELTLDACYYAVARRYSAEIADKVFDGLWIWIYPVGAVLRTAEAPNGTTVVHGQKITLTGTMTLATVLGFGGHAVLAITQASSGFISNTALVHEIGEHWVPNVVERNWNYDHAPTWHDLATAMQVQASELIAKDRPPSQVG